MNKAKTIKNMIGKLNPPGTLIFSKQEGFFKTVSYVFFERTDIKVDLLLSSSNDVIV